MDMTNIRRFLEICSGDTCEGCPMEKESNCMQRLMVFAKVALEVVENERDHALEDKEVLMKRIEEQQALIDELEDMIERMHED